MRSIYICVFRSSFCVFPYCKSSHFVDLAEVRLGENRLGPFLTPNAIEQYFSELNTNSRSIELGVTSNRRTTSTIPNTRFLGPSLSKDFLSKFATKKCVFSVESYFPIFCPNIRNRSLPNNIPSVKFPNVGSVSCLSWKQKGKIWKTSCSIRTDQTTSVSFM